MEYFKATKVNYSQLSKSVHNIVCMGILIDILYQKTAVTAVCRRIELVIYYRWCLYKAGMSYRPVFSRSSLSLHELGLHCQAQYRNIVAVNSMELNGVIPAPIIQFDLAGDLGLGSANRVSGRTHVNDLQEKQNIRTRVRPVWVQARLM